MNHRYWRLRSLPLGPPDAFPNNTTLDMRFDGVPLSPDPYAGSVVLNMRMEGAIFDDRHKAITAVGNAAISTTEACFGLSSLYLDGAGDYCTAAASTDFDFGSSAFTVEFRVMPKTSRYQFLAAINVAGQAFSTVAISQRSDGRIEASFAPTSSANAVTITTSFAVAVDLWSHIAFTRLGSTFTLWVNGVSGGAGSSVLPAKTGCSLIIGAVNDNTGTGSTPLHGYIDHLRISNGVARYTAPFVVPAVGNPVYVHQTPVCDLRGHKITNPGVAIISTNPLRLGTGALRVDDSDDGLLVDATADINTFGTDDFTIEFFVRPDSVVPANQSMLHCGTVWASALAYIFTIETSGMRFYGGNTGTINISSGTGKLTAATWAHIAVSRNSGTTRLFVNGLSVGTPHSGSVSIASTSGVYVGSWRDGTNDFAGYMDGVRITKGIGRYPANFTPPDRRVAFAYVQLKAAVDGPNLIGAGTATSSSASEGDADAAFDADITGASILVSTDADTDPALIYDFGSGNEQDVSVVEIQNSSDAGYLPLQARSIKLEYSDDDSSWSPRLDIEHTATGAGDIGQYVYVPVTGSMVVQVGVMEGRGGALGAMAIQTPAMGGRGAGYGSMAIRVHAEGFGSPVGRMILQAPLMRGYGRDTTGDNAGSIVVTAPLLVGRGGANGAMVVAAPDMSAFGTRHETATGAMIVAAPVLAGIGTAWGQAVGRMVVGAPAMQGRGGGSSSMALPAPKMQWSVTMGGVGAGTMVLRAPVMFGTGTELARGSGAMVVQAPLMFGGSNSGAIVLQAPVMSGYGHVTVAVTYEAYAVNLKHDHPDAPDEVTRYTNYPFLRIMRFQNRYFGMAADGIYLLQGDMDGEDPIAWAFATHKTDWGIRQKKRVDALFVAGRMGHSATITATVGEKPDVTYRYRSPRGPDAQNFREKIGKGLSGRYWAFGIEDANGGELYLDALDPSVHESQRGI